MLSSFNREQIISVINEIKYDNDDKILASAFFGDAAFNNKNSADNSAIKAYDSLMMKK